MAIIKRGQRSDIGWRFSPMIATQVARRPPQEVREEALEKTTHCS